MDYPRLSFKKGDVIRVAKWIDEETAWCVGAMGEQRVSRLLLINKGYFSSNYVEPLSEQEQEQDEDEEYEDDNQAAPELPTVGPPPLSFSFPLPMFVPHTSSSRRLHLPLNTHYLLY